MRSTLWLPVLLFYVSRSSFAALAPPVTKMSTAYFPVRHRTVATCHVKSNPKALLGTHWLEIVRFNSFLSVTIQAVASLSGA